MADNQPPAGRKSLLLRLKEKIRGPAGGNASKVRVRRRQAMIQKLSQRLPILRILLLVVGYLWIFAIPFPELGTGVYTDENALSPGHVRPRFNWPDVHSADQWLVQLEAFDRRNASRAERAQFIAEEFQKLGLSGATQEYTLTLANETLSGVNAYGVSPSPRTSGVEAMVISASWESRRRDGSMNLRGIATVLALAKYLKGYSNWSKDLIFVISDGYLDGIQAWLNAYHNIEQKNLEAEALPYPSGVIWNALSIDYSCHSFSHLGIFHEGVNGRLPNQDLINAFERLTRWQAGVPVVLYDHVHPSLPAWIPEQLRNTPWFENYWGRARNVFRHFGYQARGQPSGIHGLFHRHRINAFTMYANCASGPHGFYALGKAVESTLRTMNNLLERLHASFFFYILTTPHSFNKIGTFLPAPIMISVAMIIQGLTVWTNAGWSIATGVVGEKSGGSLWTRRARPLLPAVVIMILTHVLGAALFAIVSSPWFIENIQVASIPVFFAFASAPLAALAFNTTSGKEKDEAPTYATLKALNLCLASSIISIMSVLNFSMAFTFAVLLGVPLSTSAPSCARSNPARFGGYATYAILAHGWLIFLQEEVKTAIWHWGMASVWFAPLVCIVYAPLVLQAAIATLLRSP